MTAMENPGEFTIRGKLYRTHHHMLQTNRKGVGRVWILLCSG